MRVLNRRHIVVIAACASMMLTACFSLQDRTATAVVEAGRRNDALPLPHLIDDSLTIEDAYRIQRRVVREQLAGAAPAGFKAGLTSSQAQARFRADGPVAGVLAREGALSPGATIRMSELRGLNVETEVSMRVGTAISKRVTDTNELRMHIDGIAPAIELPNLHYEQPEQLSAIDIVATNVAAASYIVGEFVAPQSRDPNAVQPNLACNGKQLNSGNARDALGDQWQAALWLVNTMVDQGWTIDAGQILLTGALGRMVPATMGECSADYGSWGTIAFRIIE